MIALPHFRPAFAGIGFDPDALAYIAAVEAADGQSLESGTRLAINTFINGCKTDGIWNAIKASCILAGARTLSGALVPLKGTAPTNFNFVSGDYNRKTGLVGNGSTKYLNSNRNNNADPQDSNHNSVNISLLGANPALGTSTTASGSNLLGLLSVTNRSSTLFSVTASSGFYGSNRNSSSSFVCRVSGSNQTFSATSQIPLNSNVFIFRHGSGYGSHRLSFYSIGESLDLAALDSRVSTLMSSINSAIP